MKISVFFAFLFIFSVSCYLYNSEFILSDVYAKPTLENENLVVEQFGPTICCSPTTMTFVGDDVLILQKSDGVVRLIKEGKLEEKPALDVSVNSVGEAGMLGITSVNDIVYLYFTEAEHDGGKILGNRIYKYDWNGEELVNGVLLKELPSNLYHNGGVLVTGLDSQVYAVIGDTGSYGKLQNKPEEGKEDTGVILRVDPEGPYYAIGIRNSFGMAVDPITGNLWATENGDDDFDEINLVFPNFNSGWIVTMGPATENELLALPKNDDYFYGDPKFSWQEPVAPTAISFTDFKETDEFQDNVFASDCNTGNLYQFTLNQNRDGFVFNDIELQDNVVNTGESLDEIVAGQGFGCVTDIEIGPDGFLYVVSLSEGKIFRIMPIEAYAVNEISKENNSTQGGGCLIATATYGSELAPQVQQLRELRDNKILQTQLGSTFIQGFNDFYYSFSPIIADYERVNPVFKEAVKLVITPLISSLSILNYADMNSEAEVLGYGISLILLNVGMYVAVPAIVIMRFRK